jgi:anti-anti-sigma factor
MCSGGKVIALEIATKRTESIPTLNIKGKMPTRITQIENTRHDPMALSGNNKDQYCLSNAADEMTVLKVEGTLHLRDAELLEKICRDVAAQTGCHILLDLASISFIDSDSASVLCRMKREQGVTLEGLHLFVENVIELTEAANIAEKYLPDPGDVA